MTKRYDIETEARKHFDKAQAWWDYELGRETLYEMCDRFPGQEDVRHTISKLWLIGRSHAAALERRRAPKPTDQPYRETATAIAKDEVFRTMVTSLRDVDEAAAYTTAVLHDIHEAADHLARLFQKTTRTFKISLATKYLHFHAPSVPIFDSLSEESLAWLVADDDVPDDFPKTRYGGQLARFAVVRRRLSEAGIKTTAATLDIFLLYWRLPGK